MGRRKDWIMPDGWNASAAADGDMVYLWIGVGPGREKREESPYFDAMIITPSREEGDEEWRDRPDFDAAYYDNPRILIHAPNGGDPVLVLSMRGDKLVVVEMDCEVVKFEEGRF